MINKLLYINIAFIFCCLSGCRYIKTASLYDLEDKNLQPEHIANFYAVEILDESTADVWVTENTPCINASLSSTEASSGSKSLHLVWDKQKEENCPWLGVGIGWNSWSAKNISNIVSIAAIQFDIKAGIEDFNQIPLAIGFEDYSSQQAWTDINKCEIENTNGEFKFTTKNWTRCTLPLSAFGFYKSKINLANIKQLMLQFEASGNFYIDNIKLVQIPGKTFKTLYLSQTNFPVSYQPFSEKDSLFTTSLHNLTLQFFATKDSLLIFGETPQIDSTYSLEFLFSTNSTLNSYREKMYLTDCHINIPLKENSLATNLKNKQTLKASYFKKITNKAFKIAIPYESFPVPIDWNTNQTYTAEILYNHAEKTLWNSLPNTPYTSPANWGYLKITQKD